MNTIHNEIKEMLKIKYKDDDLDLDRVIRQKQRVIKDLNTLIYTCSVHNLYNHKFYRYDNSQPNVYRHTNVDEFLDVWTRKSIDSQHIWFWRKYLIKELNLRPLYNG